MFCTYCGKQHNRKGYYCSITCAKKHYYGDRYAVNKRKKVEKVEAAIKKIDPLIKYKCVYCGKIQTQGILCSELCRDKFEKLNDLYKKRILGTGKKKKYRDSRFDKWSKEVRKRANYVCEICGEPAIDAHHIVPVCVDDSLKYDLGNGIALCLKCHRKQHPDLPESFFKNRFGYDL